MRSQSSSQFVLIHIGTTHNWRLPKFEFNSHFPVEPGCVHSYFSILQMFWVISALKQIQRTNSNQWPVLESFLYWYCSHAVWLGLCNDTVSVHPPAAAACGGLLLWAKWVRDIDRQCMWQASNSTAFSSKCEQFDVRSLVITGLLMDGALFFVLLFQSQYLFFSCRKEWRACCISTWYFPEIYFDSLAVLISMFST